jgi:hypothetical protein
MYSSFLLLLWIYFVSVAWNSQYFACRFLTGRHGETFIVVVVVFVIIIIIIIICKLKYLRGFVYLTWFIVYSIEKYKILVKKVNLSL